MSEFVITQYIRLVEVRIVHHYFLDDGAEDFHAPQNLAETPEKLAQKRQIREKNWSLYDIRKVLDIKPTPGTDTLIKRLHGVFRQTATGFFVAVPPATAVPTTARFDFAVTVEDGNFFQYTGLPFFKNDPGKVARNQKIVEIRHDNQVYRYKPNVFVFGNTGGASRKTIINLPPDWFFLTKEIPDYLANTPYLAESLVKHNTSLYRAMRDKPSIPPSPLPTAWEQWQHISVWPPPTGPNGTPFDFDKLPSYANQNDIPDIVPPPGATGVPAKGILLTDELPDNIFALIQLEATQAPASFRLIENGQLRTPHPVFNIHFKNRAAYWRFFSKGQKKYAVLPVNPPCGLTAFGNAMDAVNNGMTNPKKPYPVAIEMDADTSTGDLLKMFANVPQLTEAV